MHCQQCGRFFMHRPCLYRGPHKIVYPDGYPFECANCHNTKK